MNMEEKDYCIDCGVEVFDGGNWGYCVPCGNRVFDKLIADKLKATNNVRPNHAVGGYRMGEGNIGMGKSKTLNRTPNHAVGEVYKPQTLRVHDPDGLYAWEERVPVWVWVMRALGALGFMVGIYCLVFLGMLL
jgi:hypothetical protein